MATVYDLSILLLNYSYSDVYKSLEPGLQGDYVLYVGAQYLWIVSMVIANANILALGILTKNVGHFCSYYIKWRKGEESIGLS